MIDLTCISKNSKCTEQKKTLTDLISKFRLYILISVIISIVKVHNMVNYVAVLLMLCIYIFALLDIFINDILPENYHIKLLYNYRHIVYMILSIMIFCISAEYIHINGYTYDLIRLWLDGGMVAVVAISDIFIRYMHIYDSTNMEPEC